MTDDQNRNQGDGRAHVDELVERRRQAKRRRRRRQVFTSVAAVAVVTVVTAAAIEIVGGRPEYSDARGVTTAGEASPPLGLSESASTSSSASTSPDPSPSASPSSTASPTPTDSPTPMPRFDAGRAFAAVKAIERAGVRAAGSAAERRGAVAIMRRLRRLGIEVKLRSVPLPNGKTSHNVIARLPGTSEKTIVLGAHMDSKPPSPGANDNGSGCGVLMDLARCLKVRPAYPTVKVVFFGAEEIIDGVANHHHFGSRRFVRTMGATAGSNLRGMISVDMVGVGPSFVVRSMKRGPQTMVTMLLARARARDIRIKYLRDPSTIGWSDHEAFERAGFPAAWVEWRDDPVYHTAADRSGHIVKAKLRVTGSFLLGFLYNLGEDELEKLRP